MSKHKNLQAMIGRSWQNKETEQVFKFLSQSKLEDIVTIATDGEWLRVSYYDLNVFMEKFVEVHVTESKEVTIIKPPVKQFEYNPLPPKLKAFEGDRVSQIADILFENIQKVKEDPGYVSQAKSISNTVQTLLNLATAELKTQTRKND